MTGSHDVVGGAGRGGSHRHRQVLGAVSVVGAFLGFGMAPLAAAPARGEEFDWLVDLLDPGLASVAAGEPVSADAAG